MNNSSTYLLPIRRGTFSDVEARELAEYFRLIGTAGCEVLVIDGSGVAVFERHAHTWSGVCRHVKVDQRFGYLNDKVNGIHTGVELASAEKIILADDDIRYTADDLEKICNLLEHCEVVRPQNYLAGWNARSAGVDMRAASPPDFDIALGEHDPPYGTALSKHDSALPWWARIEAARMLINRAILRIADYPGTCAFRRATMLKVGHYDGDVLFDNEEMIRHFARHRVSIHYANDFFVLKRSPRFRKWLEQRPRQAYEDFGLRAKTALFAALPPIALLLFAFVGLAAFATSGLAVVGLSIILAWAGRLRGSARNFFPASIPFFAPLWILERALSTYWAFYWRIRRGGYPFGDRLLSKGIGRDWVKGGQMASEVVASARSVK